MLSLARSRFVPFLPSCTPQHLHLRTSLVPPCHCTCRSFVSAVDKDDDKRPKRRGRPAKSATASTQTTSITSTSTPPSASISASPSSPSPSPSPSPSSSTSPSAHELLSPKRKVDVDVDEDVDEDTPRRRTGKYTLPTYVSPTAAGDTIPVVADVNERPTPAPTSTTTTRPTSTSTPKLGRPPLPFPSTSTQPEYHDLSDVIIINTGSMARAVIQKLMSSPICDEYHAVDTETINIDPRTQSPVGNGTMTCLSIYCGPHHDFSSLLPSPSSTPRSKIWIDVIDHDGCDMIEIIRPYIESENIKKIWHNYSFDRHILENHGLKPRGFGGDTMHMARLFDSSRDSYSLESLTHDLLGNRKRPMKERFAKPAIKKDGSIGKAVILPDVLTLQRDETTRSAWIDYSTRDTQLTWELRERLHTELNKMEWAANRTMWDFYHTHLRPFGELLCDLETVGIYIRRDYLPIIQTRAERDREMFVQTFREWAMKYQRAAKYMNITSSAQKQQFFFAPPDSEREFSTENTESYIEEGKTKPLKMFKFKLKGMGLPYTSVTAKQIPSVSMPTLRQLAGSPDSDPPKYGPAYDYFGGGERGHEACVAIHSLCKVSAVTMMLNTFIKPLQETADPSGRIHCSLNLNTETGRLSSRRPNLQNQPALEKDIYRVRDAFAAEKGNMLIVADYGQLELRVLAHMTNCKSMIEAFKLGGDFHSRTAMGMYPYIADAVNKGEVILEWDKSKGAPPAPLLKDVYASERRKAKTLNFSIAYGKTARGLSADWGVSVEEATATLNRWFADRPEVKQWQEETIAIAHQTGYTRTLMGRYRRLVDINSKNMAARSHAERAAINTPVQGGGADIVMKAMLKLHAHQRFRELNWKIILQIHDEIICEGPHESTDEAMSIVRECMAHPFVQPLLVDLTVDAKAETTWYKAK